MPEAIAPWTPRESDTVELVPTGTAWDAVRSTDRFGRAVIDRLGSRCGAVIVDGSGAVLYWLVKPGSADKWMLPQYAVSIIGANAYVAVPSVRFVSGPGLHWGIAPTPLRCLTDTELLFAAIEAETERAYGPRS